MAQGEDAEGARGGPAGAGAAASAPSPVAGIASAILAAAGAAASAAAGAAAQPSGEPPPATVLPLHLQLGPPVGQGTSGEVSPLLRSIDGGRYAIKEVKRRPGTGAEMDEAVLHEVRLHRLCSADCSAVVRYAFSYQTDEALLVVMEACDCILWDVLIRDPAAWQILDPGCNADSAIARQTSDAERLSISDELATALRHCHKLRVLHRDVNPWNVFLVRAQAQPGAPRKLCARLGDFGLAAQLPPGVESLQGMEAEGAMPLDASALGSLYSAPELGQVYGFPADVFSLGMTLLAIWASAEDAGRDEEALTSFVEATKLAASGTQPLESPDAILKDMATSRAQLRKLLLKMLSAAPGDRPNMTHAHATIQFGEPRSKPLAKPQAKTPAPTTKSAAKDEPERSRCCCFRRRPSPTAPDEGGELPALPA